MPLIRHRLKEEYQGIYFWEDYRVLNRLDEVRNSGITWYADAKHIVDIEGTSRRYVNFEGLDYIGITPNYSIVEMKLFFTQFYVRKMHLVLVRSKANPRIVDTKFPFAAMLGNQAGTREVGSLIEILAEPEVTTHVYATSMDESGRSPKVMTFSRKPPPEALYIPVGEVPMEVKDEKPKANKGVDYVKHRDSVVRGIFSTK